jgi:hypothetical protein
MLCGAPSRLGEPPKLGLRMLPFWGFLERPCSL